MNFKDLENVEHGTVLVDASGHERVFLGFSKEIENEIITERLNSYTDHRRLCNYKEICIGDWTIKQPEREKITLYEYFNQYDGSINFLAEGCKSIEHLRQNYNGYDLGQFEKIPNGRTIEIYADTFEVVE